MQLGVLASPTWFPSLTVCRAPAREGPSLSSGSSTATASSLQARVTPQFLAQLTLTFLELVERFSVMVIGSGFVVGSSAIARVIPWRIHQ